MSLFVPIAVVVFVIVLVFVIAFAVSVFGGQPVVPSIARPSKPISRVYLDHVEDLARDRAAEKILDQHAAYKAQQIATDHSAAVAPLASPAPAPSPNPTKPA